MNESEINNLEELRRQREEIIAKKKLKEQQLAQLLQKQQENVVEEPSESSEEEKLILKRTKRGSNEVEDPAIVIKDQRISQKKPGKSPANIITEPVPQLPPSQPPPPQQPTPDITGKKRGRPKKSDSGPLPKRQKVEYTEDESINAILEETRTQFLELKKEHKRDRKMLKEQQRQIGQLQTLVQSKLDALQISFNTILNRLGHPTQQGQQRLNPRGQFPPQDPNIKNYQDNKFKIFNYPTHQSIQQNTKQNYITHNNNPERNNSKTSNIQPFYHLGSSQEGQSTQNTHKIGTLNYAQGGIYPSVTHTKQQQHTVPAQRKVQQENTDTLFKDYSHEESDQQEEEELEEEHT